MIRATCLVVSCLAGAAARGGPAQAQPMYSFATIDPLGATGTFPNGVNNAGQVVGNYNDALNVSHGFLRGSDGTFTSFDIPGSRQTFA